MESDKIVCYSKAVQKSGDTLMVEVDISDVPSECQEKLKNEIECLFGKITNLKIIATKDFDNKVTEYLQKRGVTIPYRSVRAGGEVVASKILHYPLDNQQLGTCLIVNARWVSEVCGDSWEEIDRRHVFLHEMGHIIQGEEKHGLVGHSRFFANHISTRECIEELSDDILCEYVTERNSIEMMKENYAVVDLSPYFVGRLKGLIEIIVNHLKSFQKDLSDKITDFRMGRVSINDFWEMAYLRTRDILNALSLATACLHAYPSSAAEFNPVRSDQTFKKLIEKIWNEAEQVLLLKYENKESWEESLRKLSDIFLALFKSMGIRLVDKNGTMSVWV